MASSPIRSDFLWATQYRDGVWIYRGSLNFNAYLACLVIGATTFAFSWIGVQIGKSSGTWLESKAEIFGGTVLILMGIKLLAA